MEESEGESAISLLLCVGMVPSVELPATQFTVRMPSNSFQPQTGQCLYNCCQKTNTFVCRPDYIMTLIFYKHFEFTAKINMKENSYGFATENGFIQMQFKIIK